MTPLFLNKDQSKPSKESIKQRYNNIVVEMADDKKKCCCSSKKESIISNEYDDLKGYNPEANLQLGCGVPTEFAKIKEGDTVVDLGSGAGNDCFVVRHYTGESGKVIGIDFTEAMVEKAKVNTEKLAYKNVEFYLGDIENIPLQDKLADVVISNCVMNLVPDKPKAFGEVHRILKEGGHFSISDIVLTGDLSEKIRMVASTYAGCVESAIQKTDYLNIIQEAGFKNIRLQQEKQIIVPDSVLKKHLTEQEIALYKANSNLIYSITVYAEK